MAMLAETANIDLPSGSPKHLLHVLPNFGIGGVPLRIVRLINHFGKRFRHIRVLSLIGATNTCW